MKLRRPRERRFECKDRTNHVASILKARLLVVGLAGYLCLYGDWEKGKDFALIFLPPITALMGAASAASFRS